MDLSNLFTPQSIALRWTEAASNRIPYLGESLFPVRKQAGLDLSFIKGSKGVPISLMPSAFDAKATFRDRIGVSKLETEMPFFREGMKIKERDRQEILKAQDSNSPYVMDVLSRVYDDANELIDGALVAAERERMQLLFPASGEVGITIAANGVDYTYEYDALDVWKGTNYFALTEGARWNQTSTADPFKDIDTARQAVLAKTGSNIAYAIMNSATFNLLMNVNAVKNRFITSSGVTYAYPSRSEIRKVVEDTAEVRIIIYDKQYRNENKVAAKFCPDDYVALIPEGALGNTVYGTTPEEADLMGKGVADVALVNQGIAVTKETTVNPVNVNTFVSQIVLPSYERMDDVAVIKVK